MCAYNFYRTHDLYCHLKFLKWIWGAAEVHFKAVPITKRMSSVGIWGFLRWTWSAVEVHLKAVSITERMRSVDIWGCWDGFEVPLRSTSKLLSLQNVWVMLTFEVLEMDLRCRGGPLQSCVHYIAYEFCLRLRLLRWIWGAAEVHFKAAFITKRMSYVDVWGSWDGIEVPLRSTSKLLSIQNVWVQWIWGPIRRDFTILK